MNWHNPLHYDDIIRLENLRRCDQLTRSAFLSAFLVAAAAPSYSLMYPPLTASACSFSKFTYDRRMAQAMKLQARRGEGGRGVKLKNKRKYERQGPKRRSDRQYERQGSNHEKKTKRKGQGQAKKRQPLRKGGVRRKKH